MSGSPQEWAVLDAAFGVGDLATLCEQLGDLDRFPNVIAHPALGWCLVQAIYRSPLTLVADLLDAGADPNLDAHDGFAPLIAAITSVVPAPGATAGDDVIELVTMLLDHGADVGQRGINDCTPLHLARHRAISTSSSCCSPARRPEQHHPDRRPGDAARGACTVSTGY